MSSNNRLNEELGEIVRDFVVDDRDSIQALDQNLQASKLDGYGIIEGCQLTIGSGELGQGENTLETTAGRVLINGSEVSLPPLSIGIPAADDNDPRKDLVYVTENGLAVRTGEPEPWDPADQRREKAFRPAPPTKVPQQDNGTILGVVTVPANVSNIGGSDVQRRPVGANISVAGLEGIRAAIDQMAVDDLVVRNGSTISGDLSVSGSITTGGEPVAIDADLSAHTSDTSNPHSVTAAQADALSLSGGTIAGALTVDGRSEFHDRLTLDNSSFLDHLRLTRSAESGIYDLSPTANGGGGITLSRENQSGHEHESRLSWILRDGDWRLERGDTRGDGDNSDLFWHEGNFDPETKAETDSFENHSDQHESGGTDEVSVNGLSGRLAGAQNADRYKGNDIDSDGDGVVNAAESADTATTAESATTADSATNADNLGGVAADEHVLRDGSRSVTAIDILDELDLPTVDSLPDPSAGTAGLFVQVTGGGTDPEGLYYHDGTEYTRLEAGSSDVGALSQLSIDTNKDWQGFDITNVGELSSADATLTGTSGIRHSLPHPFSGRTKQYLPFPGTTATTQYLLFARYDQSNVRLTGSLSGFRGGGSATRAADYYTLSVSSNSNANAWGALFTHLRNYVVSNLAARMVTCTLNSDGNTYAALEIAVQQNYQYAGVVFDGVSNNVDMQVVTADDVSGVTQPTDFARGELQLAGDLWVRGRVDAETAFNLPIYTSNPSNRTVGDMWLVDAAGQSERESESNDEPEADDEPETSSDTGGEQ